MNCALYAMWPIEESGKTLYQYRDFFIDNVKILNEIVLQEESGFLFRFLESVLESIQKQ